MFKTKASIGYAGEKCRKADDDTGICKGSVTDTQTDTHRRPDIHRYTDKRFLKMFLASKTPCISQISYLGLIHNNIITIYLFVVTMSKIREQWFKLEKIAEKLQFITDQQTDGISSSESTGSTS